LGSAFWAVRSGQNAPCANMMMVAIVVINYDTFMRGTPIAGLYQLKLSL